jgi:hypothetical protein
MKNQIRSLQSVLFILSVVLGVNAFTSPSEIDSIQQDITEGKIQAAEASAMIPHIQQIQQDYVQMNMRFDELAMSLDTTGDSPTVLSGLSQVLYVYDQEVKSVKFNQLTLQQKKDFISHLNSLKKEFYAALSAVTQK